MTPEPAFGMVLESYKKVRYSTLLGYAVVTLLHGSGGNLVELSTCEDRQIPNIEVFQRVSISMKQSEAT